MCFVFLQPLHKGLDPANLEQLITPLTTLGHLAQLAPEQFAAPLKSLVANFIVKDLLMNDRVQTSCIGPSSELIDAFFLYFSMLLIIYSINS